MVNYHWQSVFYLSAVIGLVVAVLWVFCSQDRRSGSVTKAETSSDPGAVAEDRSFPVALVARRELCLPRLHLHELVLLSGERARGSISYAAAGWRQDPFSLIFLYFALLGGWVTDQLVPVLGLRKARLSIGMIGMALAGTLIGVGAWVESHTMAIVCLSARCRVALLHGRSLLECDHRQDPCGHLVWRDEYGRQRRRRDFTKPHPLACRSVGLDGIAAGGGRHRPAAGLCG